MSLPRLDLHALRRRTARRVALVVAAAITVAGLAGAPPAQAAALGPFSCLPVMGLSSRYTNPPDDLLRGIVNIPGYRAVNIGTGAVNWRLDPFHDAAWRKMFYSLKWLESLTDASVRLHQAKYLTRARQIAQDFAAHVPMGGGAYPIETWTPMYAGYRATTYACLEANGGSASWLTAAMNAHGTWLATHDPGDWNQGVDAAIGLLASACRVGNATWASVADTRFSRLSTTTIGADGEALEQSPGYGSYLYRRWLVAVDKLHECGRPVPSVLSTRLALLRDFIGWMTTPASTVAQIGDTQATPAENVGATDLLGYAVSGGTNGTPPETTTHLFAAGFAAGRDTWSPFPTSMYWTARWGPGRAYHGHEDHTAVTLHGNGQPLLVDSGQWATADTYRDYTISPWAHNTAVAPGGTFSKSQPTTLLRSGSGPGWTYLEMTDTAWERLARKRRVFADTDNKTMIVEDVVSRASAGGWWQLWHLPVGARVTTSGRSVATATTANGVAKVTLVQVPLPGQVLPAGTLGVHTGSTSPYLGWVSPMTNQRYAAPVVVYARPDRATSILTVAVAGVPSTSVSATAAFDGRYTDIDVTIDGHATRYYLSVGGSIWR